MASYKYDRKAGKARLYWRFEGRQYTKVLKLSEREAQAAAVLVAETIQDVARGKLVVPDGADVKAFILSGGKGRTTAREAASAAAAAMTVAGLLRSYDDDPQPNLEASTRQTQKYHFNRLRELAGKVCVVDFDEGAAQSYVGRRSKMEFRGRPIRRQTIAKELETLGQAWRWVAKRTPGLPPPAWKVADLAFPKRKAVRPFMTLGEIEREIARGGLSDVDREEIWECLWLDVAQVREVLEVLRGAVAPAFLHPMATAAAFTGARRSELCRSRLTDWDLDARKGKVRQKKRDRHAEFSFRDVPVNDDVEAALRAWFGTHPGGASAFCFPDGREVTWMNATYYLREALAPTKWSVVGGWAGLSDAGGEAGDGPGGSGTAIAGFSASTVGSGGEAVRGAKLSDVDWRIRP